jgi:hypothetical protein
MNVRSGAYERVHCQRSSAVSLCGLRVNLYVARQMASKSLASRASMAEDNLSASGGSTLMRPGLDRPRSARD